MSGYDKGTTSHDEPGELQGGPKSCPLVHTVLTCQLVSREMPETISLMPGGLRVRGLGNGIKHGGGDGHQ